MSTTWPMSLPEYPLITPYDPVYQDGSIRTDMENGPPKTRARYTAIGETFEIEYLLTDDQRTTLRNFWKTTCSFGSVSFIWHNPETEEQVIARFVSQPRFRKNSDKYIALVVLLVLPL